MSDPISIRRVRRALRRSGSGFLFPTRVKCSARMVIGTKQPCSTQASFTVAPLLRDQAVPATSPFREDQAGGCRHRNSRLPPTREWLLCRDEIAWKRCEPSAFQGHVLPRVGTPDGCSRQAASWACPSNLTPGRDHRKRIGSLRSALCQKVSFACRSDECAARFDRRQPASKLPTMPMQDRHQDMRWSWDGKEVPLGRPRETIHRRVRGAGLRWLPAVGTIFLRLTRNGRCCDTSTSLKKLLRHQS